MTQDGEGAPWWRGIREPTQSEAPRLDPVGRTEVFMDGGCWPNPGNGGWGVVILHADGAKTELFGGKFETTNNQMELQAVIEALSHLGPEHRKLRITTDSQYVRQGITAWIHSWKRRNWLTADNKPVKNRVLWETLDRLREPHDIEWRWIKGHQGHEHNERCDQLATIGRESLKDRRQ